MLNIQWNPQAEQIIKNFLNPVSYWKVFANDLSYRLGQEAIQHIKPMTHVSAYYRGNEALSNSLSADNKVTNDGFEVTFQGLWYGNYMDIGNFPADVGITRTNGKAFPVGLRSSQGDMSMVTWVNTIHGMGHTTPEAPTHFSEKTAEWLAGNIETFTDEYLTRMLEGMVGI